jgi:hypothetical protein
MHGPGCHALPVTQSLRLQAREQFIAVEIREFSRIGIAKETNTLFFCN